VTTYAREQGLAYRLIFDRTLWTIKVPAFGTRLVVWPRSRLGALALFMLTAICLQLKG
jgi:hypothetical protein